MRDPGSHSTQNPSEPRQAEEEGVLSCSGGGDIPQPHALTVKFCAFGGECPRVPGRLHSEHRAMEVPVLRSTIGPETDLMRVIVLMGMTMGHSSPLAACMV